MNVARLFNRFTRTAHTMDLRDPLDTRKARAQRFERKNKTAGKLSKFAPGRDVESLDGIEWTGSRAHRESARADRLSWTSVTA